MTRNTGSALVSGLHKQANKARMKNGAKWQTSVGYITVSTPVFSPISIKKPTDPKPLDFGALKEEASLAEALQKAGVGISDLEYQSRSLQAAVTVAGTQIDSKDTAQSKLSGDVASQLLLKGALEGQGSPKIADVKSLADILKTLETSGTFSSSGQTEANVGASSSREKSRTESFKTPDIPDLPAAPTLPQKIEEKMIKLLDSSDLQGVIHPAELASLVASLKLHMNDMEEFFNPGIWTEGLVKPNDNPNNVQWLPYKIRFNVAVEPGWYTQLNQLDAVAEVTFDARGCSDHKDQDLGKAPKHGKDPEKGMGDDKDMCTNPDRGHVYKIISVIPYESAQALEELDSAMDQFSMALQLQGAAQAVGGRAAYRQLRAIASRMEGIRTNKTLVVAFPEENSVRIRMRPNVVPNRNGRDLQPRSRLFTATVLMNNTDAFGKEKFVSAGGFCYVCTAATSSVLDKNFLKFGSDLKEKGVTERRYATLDEAIQGKAKELRKTDRSFAGQLPTIPYCKVTVNPYWEPALTLGPYGAPGIRTNNRKQYNKPFLKEPLVLASMSRITPVPFWKAPPPSESFAIAKVNGIYGVSRDSGRTGSTTNAGKHDHGIIGISLKGAKVGDVVHVLGVGSPTGGSLATKTLTIADLPHTTVQFHLEPPLDNSQPITVYVLVEFKQRDSSGNVTSIKSRVEKLDLVPTNKAVPAPAAGVSFTGNLGGVEVENLTLTQAEVVQLLTESLRSSLRFNVTVP